MIVVCAAATADRFHGFLRSVMLNLHPGVYVSADLDTGSRERIWRVLEGWWQADGRGTVVMLWRDKAKPASVDFRTLGMSRSNSKWDIGAVISDDHCLTGREKGVSGWAGASGWAYRGGGDGLKQMIPVLEHDVGGDRSQVFEEPVCGASCDDCLAPGQDPEHGGGVEPKGE